LTAADGGGGVLHFFNFTHANISVKVEHLKREQYSAHPWAAKRNRNVFAVDGGIVRNKDQATEVDWCR